MLGFAESAIVLSCFYFNVCTVAFGDTPWMACWFVTLCRHLSLFQVTCDWKRVPMFDESGTLCS
jgi:hypothetical protein